MRSVFDVAASSRWAHSDDFSVLVIDNGSTDDTAVRMRALQQEQSRLRYVLEPVAGISAARNRALAEANADFLLFIDDDETMCPGFLEAHVDVLLAHPDAAAVGGAMDLDFATGEPRWLSPVFLTLYSSYGVPEGDCRKVGPKDLLPFGGNLSLRVAATRAVGGFDHSLGRVGRSLISGEETLLLESLRDAGYEIWVTGAARIRHHIPPDRTRFRWLLRRSYAQGRTEQRMKPAFPLSTSLLRFFLGGVRLIIKRRSLGLPVLAEYVSHRAYNLGRIVEYVERRRTAGRA